MKGWNVLLTSVSKLGIVKFQDTNAKGRANFTTRRAFDVLFLVDVTSAMIGQLQVM
jgi:hypothetical protein